MKLEGAGARRCGGRACGAVRPLPTLPTFQPATPLQSRFESGTFRHVAQYILNLYATTVSAAVGERRIRRPWPPIFHELVPLGVAHRHAIVAHGRIPHHDAHRPVGLLGLLINVLHLHRVALFEGEGGRAPPVASSLRRLRPWRVGGPLSIGRQAGGALVGRAARQVLLDLRGSVVAVLVMNRVWREVAHDLLAQVVPIARRAGPPASSAHVVGAKVRRPVEALGLVPPASLAPWRSELGGGGAWGKGEGGGRIGGCRAGGGIG
mmetsp:Transcript_14316/g.45983  ORF Transcript_14316/g.45983 Transcript_14316/m.45983 type:complete len:264 (-) Transcript_14316:346-1137(-)